MIIYIDRLTLKACLVALRIVRGEKKSRGNEVKLCVLDPVPGGISSAFLKWVAGLGGLNVHEVPFFAGHLKGPDGQSVYTAAVSAANRMALTSAEKTLERSPFLFELNRRWGGTAVKLHLAKSFWRSTFHLAIHLMVADVLARKEAATDIFHVTDISPALNPEWVDVSGFRTKIHFSTCRSFRDSRLYGLSWYLAQKIRDVWRRRKARHSKGSSLRDKSTALLLMQEDELSLDRSFRTQPHWYYSEDGQLPFDVLILETGLFKGSRADKEKLEEDRIFPIAADNFFSPADVSVRHPLRLRIRKDLRFLVMKSVVGGDSSQACAEIVRLFLCADILTAFCLKQNVRVFMTCENYMGQADAMQMIASELGIHTISYQYSNMGEVGPIMMTAADTMFFFSPLYHERWVNNGIGPATFVDTGYLFDRSFEPVRKRAKSRRDDMCRSGAEFIIGYLDESVQDDKYGLIHRNDHLEEIEALISLILKDQSMGLVVKTQFQRNSPKNLKKADELFSRAARSGRYLELSHGSPRNNFFPAEAALCSDIVIGHAVGATAALEAALTGTRCILLNSYGFKGANDPLYSKVDIIYPSMESALAAIEEYRRGDPRRTNLGDWSSIIACFDSFQDGKSSVRLRHYLENLFQEVKTAPVETLNDNV